MPRGIQTRPPHAAAFFLPDAGYRIRTCDHIKDGVFNLLKKAAVIGLCLVFILFSAAVCLVLEMSIWADQPAGESTRETIFTVARGQGFAAVADALHAQGLLTRPLKFRLLARIHGNDRQIKTGEYLLSPRLSPRQLISILTEGRVRLHRLTIPEGFTVRQIGQTIQESGFSAAADFEHWASHPDLLHEFNLPADSFEGYLFPDTYLLPGSATAPQIIRTMVRRFHAVFSAPWRERARDLGFSVHQIVTLASIIEKETGTSPERPLIASVFHNRLKRRMRLEADPTVIYGIQNFNGNITRKDLKTPTPYNTYTIWGLPPGPIASPGQESLKAALYPAETRYLYFVAKADRSHHFSTNYKDHTRAVKKYQLQR